MLIYIDIHHKLKAIIFSCARAYGLFANLQRIELLRRIDGTAPAFRQIKVKKPSCVFSIGFLLTQPFRAEYHSRKSYILLVTTMARSRFVPTAMEQHWILQINRILPIWDCAILAECRSQSGDIARSRFLSWSPCSKNSIISCSVHLENCSSVKVQ